MNSELCFNCERNISSASTCVVKIFRTSFRLVISLTEILKRNSCVLPGRIKTIIFGSRSLCHHATLLTVACQERCVMTQHNCEGDYLVWALIPQIVKWSLRKRVRFSNRVFLLDDHLLLLFSLQEF